MLHLLRTGGTSWRGTIARQRLVLALLVLLSLILSLSAAAQVVDWVQVNADGFGDANNGGAPAMAVFANRLYAGTANYAHGSGVWRTDPQVQPDLSINYENGSPGSFFLLTGVDFPPDSTATVLER